MASVIYVPVIPVRPDRCSPECVQYIEDSVQLTMHVVSQIIAYGLAVVFVLWCITIAVRGGDTIAQLLAYLRDYLKERKDNRS